MGGGLLAGSAYLLLGGDTWLQVPRWASRQFYTGFFAGNWTYYHWHISMEKATVVGVITVGLTYALIALLVRLAWLHVRRR
jgi:hypothetical protein